VSSVSSSATNTPPRGSSFVALEQLVRHLGEELSSFRRRALHAEAQLKSLEAEREASRPRARPPGEAEPPKDPRVIELERENAELRRRIAEASSRTRQMVERVRFLRQQQQDGSDG
jgi:predicted RNase H-like nuclease (RuvC/YqgF family)